MTRGVLLALAVALCVAHIVHAKDDKIPGICSSAELISKSCKVSQSGFPANGKTIKVVCGPTSTEPWSLDVRCKAPKWEARGKGCLTSSLASYGDKECTFGYRILMSKAKCSKGACVGETYMNIPEDYSIMKEGVSATVKCTFKNTPIGTTATLGVYECKSRKWIPRILS